MNFFDLTQHYQFKLPEELIAKTPSIPRESARLFIYRTKTDEILFDTFANVGKYLPRPSLLVWNNTKVVPARIRLHKALLEKAGKRRTIRGGGKIEVLLMMNEFHNRDHEIKGMLEGKVSVGTRLFGENGVFFNVLRKEDRFFFLRPSFPIQDIWNFLENNGETPIPPYIEETPLSEEMLRNEYQSVLAKFPASVAAPTASLHFSETTLQSLKFSGIRSTEITHHVGAGTFTPITEENFSTKRLFTEYYDISDKSAYEINLAKNCKTPIIPVGTTSLRALESSASIEHAQTLNNISKGEGKTNLFIFPPYEFRITDGLITNFHVPGSSLLLLVDAFLSHKKSKRNIIDLYHIAIENQFRFYSFGDGMLIL